MNSTERLQRAIAGQPTDMPAVAPAYLSLYLDAQTQRLYREAYERKLSALDRPPPEVRGCERSTTPRTRVSGAEEAIWGALRRYFSKSRPIGSTPSPARRTLWAERGEMRFVDGYWLYAD